MEEGLLMNFAHLHTHHNSIYYEALNSVEHKTLSLSRAEQSLLHIAALNFVDHGRRYHGSQIR